MAGFGRFFSVVISLAAGLTAFAHDPGLSSAHLVRSERGIEVRLAFAWPDLVSLTPSGSGATRPGAAQLTALGSALIRSAEGMVRISTKDVTLGASTSNVTPGVAAPNEVVVELHWSQVPPDALHVDFPVLTKMPFGHRMMLVVGKAVEPVALLDARHATWDLPAEAVVATGVVDPGDSFPARPSWFSFVTLGIEHILTGFDHLCFLSALLLVASRLREVVTVVTTFTIAHSLTLAAAAFRLVNLTPAVVEPLIAISIIYVGLENFFLRRQPRHRLALVFGFGLIHGLGFAGALAERLPGVSGFAVVPPLLGFNAGVELGQLAVAGCLVPLIGLARVKPGFFSRMQPTCSLVIASAGFVWLLQRV